MLGDISLSQGIPARNLIKGNTKSAVEHKIL